MIDITQYLQGIYEDLQSYVDNDVCLCEFKKLNFEAGALPDYRDIHIQQLYLLRYAFAYAFEYSRMYLDVLSQMDDANHISVISMGCGSRIDYWSLIHALEMKSKMNCSIRYDGIDKIDWNYKIPQRQNDEVHYLIENAADIFTNNCQFIYDVYFFPKSISEFTDSELNAMTNSFSSKKIQKNRFFVCISLREDQGSMDRDMQKTKCLIEAISKNGFYTKWPYNRYTYYDCNDGIVSLDKDFQYPQGAYEFVKILNQKCVNYKIQKMNCQSDCQKLSRCPILTVKHIRYQVIMFERMS
jgi:hypothetical protein